MIAYKEWDSKLLGMSVGELTCSSRYVELDKIDDFDYVYSRVPVKDMEIIQTLEKSGFKTVDVYFEYIKRVDNRPVLIENVYNACESDIEPLLKISNNSFYLSRFHADPDIKSEIADTIYSTWVTNAVNRVFGDAVYIYKEDSSILGFTVCRLDRSKKNFVGIIDLTATILNNRQGNVGQKLLYVANNFFLSTGCKYIKTGTQASNISSRKLLERMDYYHSDTYITLSRRKNGFN